MFIIILIIVVLSKVLNNMNLEELPLLFYYRPYFMVLKLHSSDYRFMVLKLHSSDYRRGFSACIHQIAGLGREFGCFCILLRPWSQLNFWLNGGLYILVESIQSMHECTVILITDVEFLVCLIYGINKTD